MDAASWFSEIESLRREVSGMKRHQLNEPNPHDMPEWKRNVQCHFAGREAVQKLESILEHDGASVSPDLLRAIRSKIPTQILPCYFHSEREGYHEKTVDCRRLLELADRALKKQVDAAYWLGKLECAIGEGKHLTRPSLDEFLMNDHRAYERHNRCNLDGWNAVRHIKDKLEGDAENVSTEALQKISQLETETLPVWRHSEEDGWHESTVHCGRIQELATQELRRRQEAELPIPAEDVTTSQIAEPRTKDNATARRRPIWASPDDPRWPIGGERK